MQNALNILAHFPLRSDGRHLAADRTWFVERAWVDNVPLGDPGLSDKVAGTYWDRFLMLVAFVDLENDG